ncbi:MAG: T9SS type A sorting domain-containing protein [Ignavibacteria bacterium]|nr:T9SS type A sorting domain-containing protein [Ignavibacteria bacterium]
MNLRTLIVISFAALLAMAFARYGLNTEGITMNPLEKYSQVKVNISSTDELKRLQQNDITIEHFHGKLNEGITLVINQEELSRLRNTGVSYSVEIPDMDEYYKNRPKSSEQDMIASSVIMQNDNIDGFSYGSMGGYYTFAEVEQKLDSMRLQYPTLITAKQNRGTTLEGRTIWSVKISDNADVNESATEPAIYFDALHHAREPQAMAGTMYFMYWLLDNYNTNSEAKYIVDNREIYIIPVVNPDGYVRNQTTNPNGGGNWRKNRRVNGGGCIGVDLNRNYNYGWGFNSGSSNDPCSDTYRGPSAGSEPEVLAVKTLCAAIQPKISFSVHSEAGRYLNPYGYNDSTVAYEIYSDFSGDFASENNFTYGTVIEMLDYYSSGTTRDWLHSIGCYAWTPEVGGGSFWPTQSQIIPAANEMLPSYKYLAWVGGAYAKFQNYSIIGNGYVERNDTLRLNIGIRNKGLSQSADNVTVTVSTSYPNITALNPTHNYGSITQRQIKYNTLPISFRLTNSATYLDEIKLIVSTKQDNIETSLDTISVIVGRANVLLSDNSENGTSRWTKSGNQTMWDTTFVSYWSEGHSFADSRYGNSKNSTNNFFTLNDTINLIGAVNPRLEFMAKWATETTFDYTRIQVSTNFGNSWINLAGRYTVTVGGQPSYHGVQPWIYERIGLNAYIGQRIKLRFNYVTDGGVPGDGFYFDNFRVVNYTDGPVGITQNGNEVPLRFALYQNYPNPFNPVTRINFDIPKPEFVSIKLFDVLGRTVKTLVSEKMNAGRFYTELNASDLSGGVYFYKIEAGDFVESKKLILVK